MRLVCDVPVLECVYLDHSQHLRGLVLPLMPVHGLVHHGLFQLVKYVVVVLRLPRLLHQAVEQLLREVSRLISTFDVC